MKKILSVALVLALAFGAHAQKNPTKESSRKEHKDHKQGGFRDLNLTEDQQARFQSIREDYRKQSGDLKKQKLTADEHKKRRQELHENFRTRYESILTPDKKAKMAQQKAARKGSKKGEGKNKVKGDITLKGGKDAAKHDFAKDLDLSKEQQEKVAVIRNEFRSQSQSLRSNTSLSPEEKRTKMQDLSKAQKEKFKSVLTKEQMEKLQAQRKAHSSRNTR